MSTLKTTNIQHASAASAAITLASDGSAAATLSSLNGGPLSGARNRIINGDMRIDQRNAGASVSLSSTTTYPVDRFFAEKETGSAGTMQQSSTAPTGFKNSILLTNNATGASPAAGNYNRLVHRIEGYNVSDLEFGSANAKTFTLSFWVRSSVTGTYGIGLVNSAINRSYVATYSISAADTWEQKTITVTGDTSGTWLTTNGVGLAIVFDLGSGSSQNGTASTWNASAAWRTSGCVNWVATNSATFYITGVQLEAGTVATPYERRSYGAELALAQRYYQGGTMSDFVTFARITVFDGKIPFFFPVSMRSAPTVSMSGTKSGNTGATTVASTHVNGFVGMMQSSSGDGLRGYDSLTYTAAIEL